MSTVHLLGQIWYTMILGFITQPSIYGVIVYFLLCHESLNNSTVSLLKTHRRLSTYATTMRLRFVNERRCYATMAKNKAWFGNFKLQ